MAEVTTKLPGGPTVDDQPTLVLSTSDNGKTRAAEFDRVCGSTYDHGKIDFKIGGLPRNAHPLQLLLRSRQAKDVWSPALVSMVLSGEQEQPESNETPGIKGYRPGVYSQGVLGKRSRNFDLSGDLPEGRWGYRIGLADTLGSTTFKWFARIPVPDKAGNDERLIINGTSWYAEDNLAASIFTSSVNPTTGRPWRWVYWKGACYLVNGTDADASTVYRSGTTLVRRPLGLADPGNPTLSTPAGSLTGTYYVRIRWYDSVTGTYSGPNARLTTAPTVAPAGQGIGVSIAALTPPTRATHWQVQIATVDTPDSYDIATDLIDIGTTSTTISSAPAATADAFEYRTVGAVSTYRHANPPTGASLIAQYRGRMFYASSSAAWIVWSEADNPEHFFNDETDPYTGFNTVDGDDLIDVTPGSLMALAANETGIYAFFQQAVVWGSGSWVLDADGVNRDAQWNVLSQNSIGCVSPATEVVDQDIFFCGTIGPCAVSGNTIVPIAPEGCRYDWFCREIDKDLYCQIAYDAQRRAVLFGWAEGDVFSDNRLTRIMAFNIDKGQWSPPWDFQFSTLVAQDHTQTSYYGRVVCIGLPYGNFGALRCYPGDGLDGNSASQDQVAETSSNTLTLTKSAAGWSVDGFRNMSVLLVDQTSGIEYYRVISTNSATVLTWEGAVPDSTYYAYIGGVSRAIHLTVLGKDITVLDSIWVALRDVAGCYD